MIIDNPLFDTHSAQAKGNPRFGWSCDLRNSEDDNSQRMLNALGPGTVMPKHRRIKSPESIAIIRGKMIMRLYDNDGIITNEFIMVPSGAATGQVAEPVETVEVPMEQIEAGQWHSLKVLDEGPVVIEAKDGNSFDMLSDNERLREEELMRLNV